MFNSSNARFMIPPIITVTSGKGGVGKSVLALSYAKNMALQGIRVLLLDADIGLGNLHIFTNVTPIFTMEDILLESCKLNDAVLNLMPNLDLVPASSGVFEDDSSYNFETGKLRLMLMGSRDNYDIIIIDTASGVASKTTAFIELADQVILTVTPELSALADGYAILKTLQNQTQKTSWFLTVNMTQSRTEGENTIDKFKEMAKRFLGIKLSEAVWLPFDQNIKAILMRQSLLGQKEEESCLSKSIRPAIDRILSNVSVHKPVQNLHNGYKTSSDFRLSQGSFSSDIREEILYAQELDHDKVNLKPQVSREDSV